MAAYGFGAKNKYSDTTLELFALVSAVFYIENTFDSFSPRSMVVSSLKPVHNGTTSMLVKCASHWSVVLVQNGNEKSLWPTCEGFSGVIDAYRKSLETYELYGPTNFAPIVRYVRG